MANMRGQRNRFTIFDMMDAKGVFDLNPANATSPDYKGALTYPMMLYHPKGERRVTVPAEIINTPMGPKEVGLQTEIIHLIVNDEAEHKKAIEEGWHEHPADAMRAAGEKAPDLNQGQKLQQLEAQKKQLEEQLAKLTAQQNKAAEASAQKATLTK